MGENKKEVRSNDTKIAFDFSIKVYKRFKDIIKAIVLFGSVAKEKQTEKSDIDIVIFIDDCTVKWDEELIAWYRVELSKIVDKEKEKNRLHVNTVTLTAFWDEIKAGEPLAINVLRYGEVLVDYGGFFNPLKILLAKGKIRPSPEAVYVSLERSQEHLIRANLAMLGSVEGMYWAMVDAGHSALMAMNIVPPSPELLGELLNDFFVKTKKLDKKHIDVYNEIMNLTKDIRNGDVKSVKGSKLQELYEKSIDFVNVLTNISKLIIKDEKIIKIEEKKI
jgi:predicted nucleotidyltransferase/uncharacterized protein (UPF0332 family)